MEHWNSLIDNKQVILRFELHDAYDGPWADLGASRLEFDYLNAFCAEWATFCDLPQNKALVPLKRCDGGLCTPDETKQIRLERCDHAEGHMGAFFKFGQWSLEEIMDLGAAFKKVMEHRMGTPANDAKLAEAWDKLDELEKEFFQKNPRATFEQFNHELATIAAIREKNHWQSMPTCGHVNVEVVVKFP